MTNFADILNTKVDDIERPKNPPRGLYVFKVAKVPEQDSIADGRYDVVDFTCQAVAPAQEGLDEEIAEWGKIGDISIRHRFMFSTDAEDKAKRERSLFNLKRFLEQHLCVEGAEKMTIGEAMSSAVNHQFVGELRWRQDPNDPEIFYVEMGKTAPTED